MPACPTKLVDEGLHYLWTFLGEDEKGPGPRRTPAADAPSRPHLLAGFACYGTTRTVTRPSAPITARKNISGVVPVCVGPRPRDTPVDEQGLGTHLQLRPHKQPRSRIPDVFCVAHPNCSQA